ncbi:crotonase/enoyl-CoA hydratase family protein [Pseudonocardia ailaonensis]|uniref:Crotonase/enoyl-CoA hydratase family protein n=1 Tax=Pseudonocardia ailaonensis TaxID=367279 RepID=A0ABN2NAU5_9PSEU
MATDHLLYREDGSVATLTLNRPEVHNAISAEMREALYGRLTEFEASPRLRVAVVTGAGDRAFCAGADLGKLIPAVAAAGRPDDTAADGTARRPFLGITKPVIAAINGHALAGGMELVLGTDIRIASEHATFGLPEPRWGLAPFGGSHVRLPQQIPWARAMEILLVGDRMSAAEAQAIGLVNRVVPHEELLTTAYVLAERICENGPLAVRRIKQTVLAAYNRPWEEAFAIESRSSEVILASADAAEGPKAFLEKRAPRFTGR